MPEHKHRLQTERTIPFFGPVAQPERPAAHGGLTVIAKCRCGAERRTNINGRHTERGPWIAPAKD